MKVLLLLIAALVVACRDAVVISADGNVEVGFCLGEKDVPVCVANLCPRGAFMLKGADRVDGPAIVRCLSAEAGAP